MADDSAKINLAQFTLPRLIQWFETELNEPRFRAVQVWQWMWQKLARNFDDMTNVSRKLRLNLARLAEISWPRVERTQQGADGTIKMLLGLPDGEKVESVLIPAPNRAGQIRWSQCLSVQVGCSMGCSFCATGTMGLKRNMTMAEILGQVAVGREILGDTRADLPVLRNLVFMGMGEPLLNMDALMPALQCLHDEQGFNFSPRRITVSTCGIKNGLERLGESGLAYLAVSLHAPTQELREKIMPKAAGWPLEDMIRALSSYPLKTRERITFEYLLLGGINDSPQHARELVRLLTPVKAKLNLIVFNPVPGLPYRPPAPEAVEAFQKVLWEKHVTAILRKSRGADIAAACGQLVATEPDLLQ